jgi:hypothetical protein
MGLQESDRFDRIEASVIHPVVCRTQAREVIGDIVPGVLVQMRHLQTRRDLQAANCTTPEGTGGI